MLEAQEPAVYLCPTTQLVDQVILEAGNLGIPAVRYPSKQPLPGPEATGGKAIIVCTYSKLFNAKTTFDRDDVRITPCAIVLDDAHAGIDEVRSAFTLSISDRDNESGGDAYKAIVKMLDPDLQKHRPGQWDGIKKGDASALLEVPFWVWSHHIDSLRRVLEELGRRNPHVFVWGFLRDSLQFCRCVISGSRLEVFFDVPPVHLARSYFEAKHRVFMSATLSDDSALVRELGCSAEAARTPVLPASDAGVGERMVLAPFLVNPSLDRDWIMKWCKRLANRWNVAVLSDSEANARKWENVGAVVELGDAVKTTIDGLRSGSHRFVAFAQRYDGVDLPDEACRVLVLDGMPRGQGLAEDHDHNIPGRPGGELRRWAYRIEQGMGRAVRSNADFAVVIMAGPELANFLAKKTVRQMLGATTRKQLDLAEELVHMAQTSGEAPTDALGGMVNKCLSRDAGWKSFYDKRVRSKVTPPADDIDAKQIQLAEAEQLALRSAIRGDSREACSLLNDAISQVKPSEHQTGWMMQRLAMYTYSHDPSSGLETQKWAHKKNEHMCPPPTGVVVRANAAVKKHDAANVIEWFSAFSNGNGAIAAVLEITAKLRMDRPHGIVEQGLQEAACVFGAVGTRPEKVYGRGPDGLWEWAEFSWVIEAKNERSKLPKADGEQLLSSMALFSASYPERNGIPVVVAVTEARA